METKKRENLVWHYSRAEYLPLMEESGSLIPKSEAEMYKQAISHRRLVSMTPFIWFSSNQYWEPLCIQLGLHSERMTWQEQASAYGAIRFGLSSLDERLLNWKQTCIAGGSNRDERRRREKLSTKARKMGSDVKSWFTSTQPIPLDDLYFEVWFHGLWRDLERKFVSEVIKQRNEATQ